MPRRHYLIFTFALLVSCSPSAVQVSVSKEFPGPNCPNGGQRIDIVQDGKTTTSYVCNGADSPTASVSTTKLPPGDPHCPTGGIALQVGDGQPQYLCNGPATTWTVIDSDTQAEPGHGYLAKRGALGRITLTLPANGSLKDGDEIRVANLARSGMNVLVSNAFVDNGLPSGSLSALPLPWGDWSAVDCSPDGQHVVAAQATDDSVPSTDPGIYVSDDFGKTWTKTAAPKASWVSVAESGDGKTILASTYTRIFLSSDGGLTWGSAPGVPAGKWPEVAISDDGTHLVVAGKDGGIYASSTGGKSWVHTSAPAGPWTALAVSPDGLAIVAGGYDGIYLSDDGGITWTNTYPPVHLPSSLAMSPSGSVVYATTDSLALLRSKDGGKTWADINLDPASVPSYEVTSVCVNSTNARYEAVVAAPDGTVVSYARWGSPPYLLHPDGRDPYDAISAQVACGGDGSHTYVAFSGGTLRSNLPQDSLSVEAGSSLDLVSTPRGFLVAGTAGQVLAP